MLPATLQFLIVMLASSINERMQKRLDYKTEEVLVLKEIVRSVTGKCRIDFTDGQRNFGVKIPPKSPNCNPFAERFVLTIKNECLRHFVSFGQRHLRFVISEYMAHDTCERFHQGIGSSLIKPAAANDNTASGEVRCRSRFSNLLNFYYREAA